MGYMSYDNGTFDMFSNVEKKAPQEAPKQEEINFLKGETFTKFSDLSANAKDIVVDGKKWKNVGTEGFSPAKKAIKPKRRK